MECALLMNEAQAGSRGKHVLYDVVAVLLDVMCTRKVLLEDALAMLPVCW